MGRLGSSSMESPVCETSRVAGAGEATYGRDNAFCHAPGGAQSVRVDRRRGLQSRVRLDPPSTSSAGPMSTTVPVGAVSSPSTIGFLRNPARISVAKASRISSKYTLESRSRSGDILQEAKEGDFGTIVMGRRGLSSVHEFPLGRVTTKVLNRADHFALWIVP